MKWNVVTFNIVVNDAATFIVDVVSLIFWYCCSIDYYCFKSSLWFMVVAAALYSNAVPYFSLENFSKIFWGTDFLVIIKKCFFSNSVLGKNRSEILEPVCIWTINFKTFYFILVEPSSLIFFRSQCENWSYWQGKIKFVIVPLHLFTFRLF